jgi:hypothetical protein
MKFLITETQYSRLFEQPDTKFDNPYNKELRRKYSKPVSLSNLSIDDAVDVISGLIDGIPGIGNLISAGIDVSHALTYFVRFLYSNDEDTKIEMATLGIITLGIASIPVAGNALPIVARKGVKEVLKTTPKEILLIGKNLGLYKKTVIFLSKTKWKYNLLLVLARICGDKLSEILTNVVIYVKDLIQKIQNTDIKKALQSVYSLLNELLVDTDAAIKIAKNLK